MEQLFKQHAPDVEVFPKEGSGIPPQMAKNIPTLATFTSVARAPDAPTVKENDLDVLSHVKQEDESTVTDHFGQMALDAEGHLRYVSPVPFHTANESEWDSLQLDRWLVHNDTHRNIP